MAMLVLPAPVGAQTSRFSLLVKAVGKMRLWMRFSCLHSQVGSDCFQVRAIVCDTTQLHISKHQQTGKVKRRSSLWSAMVAWDGWYRWA